jgi:hypothetical protein
MATVSQRSRISATTHQVEQQPDAPQRGGGGGEQPGLARPRGDQDRRGERQGLGSDDPQQPAAVDAAKDRVLGAQQHEACGHAVGQQQPRRCGPGAQDSGDERMPGEGEPDAEHVQAGGDGEEAEHPVGSVQVGGHAGPEGHQPGGQRDGEHEQPGAGSGQQRQRQPRRAEQVG